MARAPLQPSSTMLQLFGLTLPDRPLATDRALATALAERMTAATQAPRQGAPGPGAADLRRDARAYLTARRQGTLRFDAHAVTPARSCDESAHALLRLTLDAPPIDATVRMVA